MPAYKDEKRGTWMAMITYTDIHGKKRRKAKRGFNSRRDAKNWETDFLAFHTKDIDVKLDAFFEMYMNDLEPRIRKSTYRGKRLMYSKHISPVLGHRKISELKPSDVLDWQNETLKKKFSGTYLRSLNSQILAIMNHAEKFYGLDRNPFKRFDQIGTDKALNVNFWTKDEFSQFISVVDDPSSYIQFSVPFYTGIRVGELIALKLKDINLEKRIISINKSAQYESSEYIFSDTKTPKSRREIALPQFLVNTLREFISKFYFISPDEQVFMTNKGRLAKELRKYALIAGVKIIRVHDLRHSHASFLVDQGVTPLLIQERLGHEKIETTLSMYSHLYPNKQMHLADYMDQVIVNNAIPILPTDSKVEVIEYRPIEQIDFRKE